LTSAEGIHNRTNIQHSAIYLPRPSLAKERNDSSSLKFRF